MSNILAKEYLWDWGSLLEVELEPHSYNFDIISLGVFAYSHSGDDVLHPVKKNCEAKSVKEYFCECSYSDEKLDYDINEKINEDSLVQPKSFLGTSLQYTSTQNNHLCRRYRK